jgi:hypothetical protein
MFNGFLADTFQSGISFSVIVMAALPKAFDANKR